MNVRSRLALLLQVARAVAFAHSRLVVHRDLKPSNILVTTDGQVRLLDFGIAKLMEGDRTQETQLTQMAGRALTLDYASPEQIRGEQIGTASDVYSLGVVAYELLAGAKPYKLKRGSAAELEETIATVDAPLASATATDMVARKELRGDLDAILNNALRKDAQQRYASVDALAQDIERHLRGEPVLARPDRAGYRLRKFAGRNRVAVVASAAVVFALLAGATVALWQHKVAGEDAARADTVKAFVLAIVAQADPAATRETRDADLTLLTTAEQRLSREISVHPALALELRLAIARAYRNRGEFERTRATLRQAIAEAQQSLPPDDLQLARAWIEISDWQMLESERVGSALDRAIETARKLGDRGTELLIDGLQKRAGRRFRSGSPADGMIDVRDAYDIAVRRLAAGHPARLGATAALSNRLGPADATISERLALTEQAYAAALANTELGPSDPRLLELKGAHAFNLFEAGRPREAIDLLRAAENAARQHHGGGLPTETALLFLMRGSIAVGDVAGALEAAQRGYALAVAREPAGGFNRSIRADNVIMTALASRRIELAAPMLGEFGDNVFRHWPEARRVWLMNYTGDTVGAARFAVQAIENAARNGWPWHASSARLGWSYALRQDGRPEEAERVLQPLPPESESIVWNEHENINKERAAVWLARGHADKALALADAAIKRLSTVRLQADPYLSDLYLIRGQALLELGRSAEAIEAFRLADDFWRSYDAGGHWAAEASYWLARALLQVGDSSGRPMLKAAQSRLAKSPMPSHRRWASTGPPAR